ncbi:MAG: hypothetical protein NTZ10_03735 [Candidatus Saganbacteria bacterium]|nr:hypothetical protein [Candidatus Saganbacteria bacterium]
MGTGLIGVDQTCDMFRNMEGIAKFTPIYWLGMGITSLFKSSGLKAKQIPDQNDAPSKQARASEATRPEARPAVQTAGKTIEEPTTASRPLAKPAVAKISETTGTRDLQSAFPVSTVMGSGNDPKSTDAQARIVAASFGWEEKQAADLVSGVKTILSDEGKSSKIKMKEVNDLLGKYNLGKFNPYSWNAFYGDDRIDGVYRNHVTPDGFWNTVIITMQNGPGNMSQDKFNQYVKHMSFTVYDINNSRQSAMNINAWTSSETGREIPKDKRDIYSRKHVEEALDRSIDMLDKIIKREVGADEEKKYHRKLALSISVYEDLSDDKKDKQTLGSIKSFLERVRSGKDPNVKIDTFSAAINAKIINLVEKQLVTDEDPSGLEKLKQLKTAIDLGGSGVEKFWNKKFKDTVDNYYENTFNLVNYNIFSKTVAGSRQSDKRGVSVLDAQRGS